MMRKHQTYTRLVAMLQWQDEHLSVVLHPVNQVNVQVVGCRNIFLMYEGVLLQAASIFACTSLMSAKVQVLSDTDHQMIYAAALSVSEFGLGSIPQPSFCFMTVRESCFVCCM